MTYNKTMTRIIALALAVLTLFGLMPTVASASSIADGSTTC